MNMKAKNSMESVIKDSEKKIGDFLEQKGIEFYRNLGRKMSQSSVSEWKRTDQDSLMEMKWDGIGIVGNGSGTKKTSKEEYD